MLLPHAGPSQKLARLGCLAAQCEFQTGDAESAGRDLLAVLVLGRRMGGDLTLNSILIQFAIEQMVAQVWADNLHSLPRAMLVSFNHYLQSAPARRTLAQSIRYDKEYMLGWYEQNVELIGRQNVNKPGSAMGSITELLATLDGVQSDNWRQRLQKASAGNPEDVLNLLRQTESLYDEAVRVLETPYSEFERSAEKFRNRINREVNPFPKAFLTAFVAPHTCEKEFRAATTLAMLQTGIEYKLHGAGVLKEMWDPVGGQPFSLVPAATGFKLNSTVRFENQCVTLEFVDSMTAAKP
jgi:hypothetical protein